MIDITKAQAQQFTTKGGLLSEWKISLDGEHLYSLPATFTVQHTFDIRNIVEKMMKRAYEEGKADAEALADIKITTIVNNGNSQLELLKQENIRLATILEQLTNNEAA